ncbi:DNA methylase [Stenotrophomonas sp. LGBM10]|uniref:DNA methylase n=1 Tax=Stenotrophomonas sp. LGBM10 TaxID=3390038 RepID=UPI00398B17C0
MAKSPSHRFGQIIGDLLEEIILPQLQTYCDTRGLYLDKKGKRTARSGSKVSWQDRYENVHDLDFVIESGGTDDVLGRPVAFIEAAWRRYTKHSRAKAQEIQGAVMPIAEKHHWDKPFLGVILAGVFTKESLAQMRSCGFETILMPYDSIVEAFASVGIDARFDEDTPDQQFAHAVEQIEALTPEKRASFKAHLTGSNKTQLEGFFDNLKKAIDRGVSKVMVMPLHGAEREFAGVDAATQFVAEHDQSKVDEGAFRKYEILVRYSNGDRVEASFEGKDAALRFLAYIGATAH